MQTQVNFKIDNSLKENTENILNKLGITLSEAMRMFCNKIVLEGGIPFDLKLSKDNYKPNEETRQAILQGEYEEVNNINDLWK